MMIRSVVERRILLCVLLVLSLSAATAAQNPVDLIQTRNIKAEMFFLSADEMAGRKTASHEAQIAANYIASEFLRFGLKPMGDDGTYFQNFDLVTAWPDMPNMALVARRNGVEKSYQLNHDFDFSDLLESNNPTTVTGPLVFLGYGVNAPEYEYDDFSGIDLHGKIALVLTHEPQESDPNSRFKGKWNTIHAYDVYKYEQIRKAGAAALLIVHESTPHRPPDNPSAPHDWSIPTPLIALAGSTWDLPIFGITEATADELLSNSGKTIATLQKAIDQGFKPQSFPVAGVEITMKKALRDRQVVRARNVIALLEGSDPKIKDEYVVISGHYDHMGIVQGRIYRGADDNASGTIGVLESARAYTQGKVRPRRSIIFAAFDAEEAAMLGAEYFVENPVLPLAKAAANLNMDMIGRDENTPTWKLDPGQTSNSVNLVGTLYNPDLRRIIEKNNQTIGLQLDFKTDTSDPEQWFDRSDHIIFATKSIPMVLFNTGEHRDYHTENDTWDKINYPKLEKIIRLVFLTSVDVANSDSRPRFIP
jgi:Zn-dependent M28 family amino/carboxypeptidase